MKYSYIIIDDNAESLERTIALAQSFPKLDLVGTANNYEDGLNLILEHNPSIVFLEIDPQDKQSKLSLALINELYRYLHLVPRIIVTTSMKELAYDAIRHEVFDYLIKPLELSALRRALFKLEKMPETVSAHLKALHGTAFSITPPSENGVQPENLADIVSEDTAEDNIYRSIPLKAPPLISTKIQSLEENIESAAEISKASADLSNLAVSDDNARNAQTDKKPLIICVKSYGDYRFIEAREISYLKADNNSTDIHLQNGEMITAFKTLKHFEVILTLPFMRIHNSYIVNINFVSRIHTGTSVCYIKNTNIKLPFSKSYRENVDGLINTITSGNYLEF